jgi:hypothetical protein
VSKESDIAEHGVSSSLELLPSLSSEPGELKLELLDGLALNEDRLRIPKKSLDVWLILFPASK